MITIPEGIIIAGGMFGSYILGFTRAKSRAQRWLNQSIKNGTLKVVRR